MRFLMVMHSKLTFEYTKITPHIYIGTNMCCLTHFKKTLLKEGITADISLEGERIDAPFGVDYYIWLPTKNHHAPSQKQLRLGVHMLDFCVKQKINIYVHCERGHGRAPSLVAAYLAAQKNMTVIEAIAFIKRKRPKYSPK